jgi:hypothetical protein
MQERKLHKNTDWIHNFQMFLPWYALKGRALAGWEQRQESCVHYIILKGIFGRFCTMTACSIVTSVILCSATGLRRSFQNNT